MSSDDPMPPASRGSVPPSDTPPEGPSERLQRQLTELTEQVTSLRQAEAEWRQLIETLPQIVWITRPDGWHTHFNRQWLDFTGLTLEESLGHGWNPPFHPEDRGRAAERWQHATSTGEPYEIEYRLRRADGAYRWMLGRATPLRDTTGTIIKWFGTCTDIEDLKQTQAELQRSRALGRLAGSMARLGSWSLDVTTNEVRWSEELYEIFEHSPDAEVDVYESLDRYLPESRSRLDAALKACVVEGAPFDLELQLDTYRGRRLWVRVMGEAQRRPHGAVSHVIGGLQDITSSKEAARQNEILAERLTTTLASITDGFFTLDRNWRFTYVNPVAEQLLQRDGKRLLGKRFWDEFAPLLDTVAGETYERAMLDNVTAVIDDYYYEPLDAWFRVNIYPSEQGLAVYFNDVTEQVRSRAALHRANEELNEANEQLEDAAQLKDDLLSMASHELRTPLTPILGFAEVLGHRASNLDDEQQQMVGSIGNNARRMLRLVDDLLVVSRAAADTLSSRPQDVSAREVLLPLLDELGDSLGNVDLGIDRCRLTVDPQHLQQMVTNLLTNAAKYGEPPVVVTAVAAGPGRVALEVADQGPGVPLEFQERMWERYEQKDRGDTRTASGTGLGLAIIRMLAEENGGRVAYRDGSPSGAVFSIELPGYLT